MNDKEIRQLIADNKILAAECRASREYQAARIDENDARLEAFDEETSEPLDGATPEQFESVNRAAEISISKESDRSKAMEKTDKSGALERAK